MLPKLKSQQLSLWFYISLFQLPWGPVDIWSGWQHRKSLPSFPEKLLQLCALPGRRAGNQHLRNTISSTFLQIQASCPGSEGSIWHKVVFRAEVAHVLHPPTGWSDVQGRHCPPCPPLQRNDTFWEACLRQARSLYTWFPLTGWGVHFLTSSSALGNPGHFKESFVSFARLPKLPLVTSCKEQVFVGRGLHSEFCCEIGQPVRDPALEPKSPACTLAVPSAEQEDAFSASWEKSEVYKYTCNYSYHSELRVVPLLSIGI